MNLFITRIKIETISFSVNFTFKIEYKCIVKNMEDYHALSVHEFLRTFEDSESDFGSDSDSDLEKLEHVGIEPPIEKPGAISDEDSDLEDTGNADRLPRRILVQPVSFSKGCVASATRLSLQMSIFLPQLYRLKKH